MPTMFKWNKGDSNTGEIVFNSHGTSRPVVIGSVYKTKAGIVATVPEVGKFSAKTATELKKLVVDARNAHLTEEVEIEFYNMHNGTGPHKTTILRGQAGGCCDPRTETYWSM